MKNFAKSILNYFAAFNETRFRFSSKLPYEWSNDPFTLDFSVFPAFEKQLLDAYYKFKGWNSQGIPTAESLHELGLDYVKDDFIRRGILTDNQQMTPGNTSTEK